MNVRVTMSTEPSGDQDEVEPKIVSFEVYELPERDLRRRTNYEFHRAMDYLEIGKLDK